MFSQALISIRMMAFLETHFRQLCQELAELKHSAPTSFDDQAQRYQRMRLLEDELLPEIARALYQHYVHYEVADRDRMVLTPYWSYEHEERLATIDSRPKTQSHEDHH